MDLIKRIIFWIKKLMIIRQVLKVIISILGPVMSIYLMVDDFMNKDKQIEL